MAGNGRIEYTRSDSRLQNKEWGDSDVGVGAAAAGGLPSVYTQPIQREPGGSGGGSRPDVPVRPIAGMGPRSSSAGSMGSELAEQVATLSNQRLADHVLGDAHGSGVAASRMFRRDSGDHYPGRSLRSSVNNPLVAVPAAVRRLRSGGVSGGELYRIKSSASSAASGSNSGCGVTEQRRGSGGGLSGGADTRPSRYRRRSSDGGSAANLALQKSARLALDQLEGGDDVDDLSGPMSDDEASEYSGRAASSGRRGGNRRASITSQESITHEMLARYREAELGQRAYSATAARAGAAAAVAAASTAGTSRRRGTVSADRRDRRRSSNRLAGGMAKIFDDPSTVMGYTSVPLLEIERLPRGGLSFDTKAVGRIQFGIPPETIKDSMRLGIEVPRVYIVPVERFCREMGPALGINVAEFEFPAYFNYFVHQKRCTLVVESSEAEANIRRVFGETLLGPAQFRNHDLPKPNEEEDFDPRFPVAARPNFYNESNWFRTQERTQHFDELCIEMLVEFQHYTTRDSTQRLQEKLGVPPSPPLTTAEADAFAFYDEFNDASDKSPGGLGVPQKEALEEALPPSAAILHDSNSLKLSESIVNLGEPKHGKRLHESLKEKLIGRRHTTWLEGSESESDSGCEGSDEGMIPCSLSAASQGRPRAGGELFFRKSAPVSAPCVMNGVRCIGCEHCQGGGGAAAVAPVVLPACQERPKLRRVVSNPDFLSTSSRNLEASAAAEEMAAVAAHVASSAKVKHLRRRSVDSKDKTKAGVPASHIGQNDGSGDENVSWASGASFFPDTDDEGADQDRSSWMYSQAKWLGDVATIWPTDVSEEGKRMHRGPRVEIFKMTGGTEYIVHDVDENNTIVGKARFSGTVRVPDEIAVEGFTARRDEEGAVDGDETIPEDEDEDVEVDPGVKEEENENGINHIHIPKKVVPPTFHPPSFGVTVLGNSHGFDKNGSTSGYVLWVNGRGVMIDPPPYASAALEREGIRPRMIIAIIITHCHADHDAGAFQKVMTGSRVAVITTPTIYKSFIRKYAALSGLNPELLRHSHRHRPAIVGQPLKFQGATFHFTYTLHTIPCIAFKVEWRGRSMVFTGDHMNIPDKIASLQKDGVLTKERADSIRGLPLLDCDLLLHESGAPPIHTPLDVLLDLPEEVKQRLYVVHTSALPKECELKVAPTGTAGTIRLDELKPSPERVPGLQISMSLRSYTAEEPRVPGDVDEQEHTDHSCLPERIASHDLDAEIGVEQEYTRRNAAGVPPLVLLRPTCVSDAWFILNLLSAVPFLSSLSYSNTMEVLETAQVEVFCADEIVIPAQRRRDVLCVVWEGTCIEKESQEGSRLKSHSNAPPAHNTNDDSIAVWHAGDWTGPTSLQPECTLSADCTHRGHLRDVVAVSSQGVKVIMVAMKDLHEILKSGSALYRKYLAAKETTGEGGGDQCTEDSPEQLQNGWVPENSRPMKRSSSRIPLKETSLYFMEIISYNSALSNLTALQKRHLESLADGPRYFDAGQLIWQVGAPVDFSFLIVSGTAHFLQPQKRKTMMNRRGSTGSIALAERLAYRNLASGRAALSLVQDKLINVSPNSEYARLEVALQLRVEEMETEAFNHSNEPMPREKRVRSARDRFANKVLSRLYARHAFTSGIVFSRGHFLSDTSRMVSGSLAYIQGKSTSSSEFHRGEGLQGDPGANHYHTSNIAAGQDGCVVMIFPRDSLISFLDAHPGVLQAFSERKLWYENALRSEGEATERNQYRLSRDVVRNKIEYDLCAAGC
eukprot:CAMPEP_0113592972 /NCGR_PEP_ID=MMETSP0015_2-20120614/38153_1 /TAXON_ID=2838 /ORGANISM="Odontella" /LENGTH=1756 /DNA_ID=CAMNT_0000499587 /DNA_START=517 /DNA_END=5788 /DNA_ORIENTATION=+ /assembly_acc=CAM_ASM_000160